MNEIKKVVIDTIREVLEQKSSTIPKIEDNLRLIEDLGFSSLDIAQLIACLEIELDVDPFLQGASISSIDTVGTLYAIYQSPLYGNNSGAGKNE